MGKTCWKDVAWKKSNLLLPVTNSLDRWRVDPFYGKLLRALNASLTSIAASLSINIGCLLASTPYHKCNTVDPWAYHARHNEKGRQTNAQWKGRFSYNEMWIASSGTLRSTFLPHVRIVNCCVLWHVLTETIVLMSSQRQLPFLSFIFASSRHFLCWFKWNMVPYYPEHHLAELLQRSQGEIMFSYPKVIYKFARLRELRLEYEIEFVKLLSIAISTSSATQTQTFLCFRKNKIESAKFIVKLLLFLSRRPPRGCLKQQNLIDAHITDEACFSFRHKTSWLHARLVMNSQQEQLQGTSKHGERQALEISFRPETLPFKYLWSSHWSVDDDGASTRADLFQQFNEPT